MIKRSKQSKKEDEEVKDGKKNYETIKKGWKRTKNPTISSNFPHLPKNYLKATDQDKYQYNRFTKHTIRY